jgi:cystathionine beta-lyase
VCDIRAICDAAHAAGALVCVDNSFITPLYQRPLELGADLSMLSGTKFVGGHSDVTLGLLAVKGAELAKRVYFLQNAEGAGLAPFDCWLALRGLKTMALRMERQTANAGRIAAFLAAHPLVKRVNYAGLPSHPGHALHFRQATSAGSIISFETGSVEASKVIAEETRLFKITVSFGNVTSLISLPCYMSHASIPPAVRAARGLPDDLVRISAGIEDVDDLLADLDQAMRKAAAAIGLSTTGAAAGGNGAGNGAGAAAAREAALLERIQALEAQLSARKS